MIRRGLRQKLPEQDAGSAGVCGEWHGKRGSQSHFPTDARIWLIGFFNRRSGFAIGEGFMNLRHFREKCHLGRIAC
jgi:hypothetical protein